MESSATEMGDNVKYVIASDIHGSSTWCDRLVKGIEQESPDQVILLGDLLYHGPRNPLPDGYDPPKVAAALNAMAEIITAVRGNCDSEVDQMVLDFPILSDNCLLFLECRTVFATHGDIIDEDRPPKLHRGDVLLAGHTHLQVCRKHEEGWIFMNPGSVSIPKGKSVNGYMTVEDDRFLWKDFSGRVCMAYTGD